MKSSHGSSYGSRTEYALTRKKFPPGASFILLGYSRIRRRLRIEKQQARLSERVLVIRSLWIVLRLLRTFTIEKRMKRVNERGGCCSTDVSASKFPLLDRRGS